MSEPQQILNSKQTNTDDQTNIQQSTTKETSVEVQEYQENSHNVASPTTIKTKLPTSTVATVVTNTDSDSGCDATPNPLTTNTNITYSDNNKYLKLFLNKLFCVRILILLLSILLLILSVSYCIAQFINVELDLIVVCPQRKTKEQIWKHHYANSINGEISVESQYGWSTSNDKCWTTRPVSLFVDEDNLWNKNNYTVKPNNKKANVVSVIFAFIALYALAIIVYNIVTIITDIINVKSDKLYTKSKLYKEHLLQCAATNSKMIKSSKKPTKQYKCIRVLGVVKEWFGVYFGSDTTGWILRSFTAEYVEIIIQTIALLLYNGYYVFDKDNKYDVYLAYKSNFIVLFAWILSLNCFLCGILW
eukprot:406689_1